MVYARTQPGLPIGGVIDPRASHRLSSPQFDELPQLLGGAQNLRALRRNPAFADEFDLMHEDDAAVVELPYFNKDNTYFTGQLTPGGLVDALHAIRLERRHPIFLRSVFPFKDDVAFIRESFNQLVKKKGGLNPDFADHVHVVTLTPDDYNSYMEHDGSHAEPSSNTMASGGAAIAVAGLIVLPLSSREDYIRSLVHEMTHQLEMSVYVVPNDKEDAPTPLPAHTTLPIDSEAIEFHLLKGGLQLSLVDRLGNIYNAFTGFNEGLTQLFANEMLLKLAPQLGVDAEDLIFAGGCEAYPLHVMLTDALLTEIANTGVGKQAAFDRAFRSFTRGTPEIVDDLRDHFGEGVMRRLARVGAGGGLIRLLVATTPELEHLHLHFRNRRTLAVANSLSR